MKNIYGLIGALLFISICHNNLLSQQQRAINLDGVNDYINLNLLAPTLAANQNHFTIEFWMKANSTDQNGQIRTTLLSIEDPQSGNNLTLFMGGENDQDGRLLVYGNVQNNTPELVYQSANVIGDNECHHIAYSYDGVNHVGKIYIDGVLENTHSIIIALTANDLVSIGQDWENTTPSKFLKGSITDLRFWEYIKSDPEILSNLYTIFTGTENGFMGLYKFNEGTINGNNTAVLNMIDSSPNSRYGSYQNFAMTGATSNFILNPCSAVNTGMNGTFAQTINTVCNGADCQYDGPSILINELMVSPTNGDGSISSAASSALNTQRGEWIELYNPNLCEPVDIGCYYLGNYTNEGNGGFIIPPNTIVPPAGFCILRGLNAPSVPSHLLVQNGGNVVEIVFPAYITNEGICASGTRVWFPNAGGWFAFYDRDGVPQDAIAWGNGNTGDQFGQPCTPSRTACGNITGLMSYNQIPADRKFQATNVPAGNHMDQSIRRQVDGGTWNQFGTPTYATCNGPCEEVGTSTCDGTATINIEGGTAPYSYLWNDSQTQMTQTAVGLCEGEYIVVVTDAANHTQEFTVTIENFVPTVTATIQNTICLNETATPVNVQPVPNNDQTGTLTGNGVTAFSFDPATAGVGAHTLTYVFANEHECTNQATTQITVNPLPNLTWNINSSYCIPAVEAHNLTLSPTGGTLAGPGMSGSSFNANTAGAGTHNVSYTFTDNNSCQNMINTTVIVHQTVPAEITSVNHLCVSSPIYTPSGNLPNGVMLVNNVNVDNGIDPSQMAPGNYTIIYTGVDQNNCPSQDTHPIQIVALPILQIDLPHKLCTNGAAFPLSASPAGGTFSGDLTDGIVLDPNLGTSGTTYTVTYDYTDPFGCSNVNDHSFILLTPIQPVLDYTTDCFFNVIVTYNSPSFSQVTWDTEATTQTVQNGAVYFNYPLEGIHDIYVLTTDINGCQAAGMLSADLPQGLLLPDYQVANVITANGDNINDEIQMSQKFDDCIDYTIDIVNRWGLHVYTADKINRFKGLDFGGNQLPEGVYFFEVKSDDVDYTNEKFKPYRSGFITILR